MYYPSSGFNKLSSHLRNSVYDVVATVSGGAGATTAINSQFVSFKKM